MNRRPAFSKTLLAAVIVFPLLPAAAPSTTSQDAAKQGAVPEARTKAALDRMTPAQKEHAKLHQERSSGLKAKLLDEKMLVDQTSDYGWVDPRKLKTPRQWITELTCRSDATLSGFVLGSEVLPIEDGSMLFTDYTVQVTEVIRLPPEVELFNAQTVTVTRPGGLVRMDGVVVGTRMSSFPPLNRSNDYLFFVKFLPTYKTFHASVSDSALVIRGGRAFTLSLNPTVDADLINAGLDLQSIKEWVNSAQCK